MRKYLKRIPYSEQLQDDRWKTKRNTILLRDHHKCKICGFEGNADRLANSVAV